jgi:hypothetical protein
MARRVKPDSKRVDAATVTDTILPQSAPPTPRGPRGAHRFSSRALALAAVGSVAAGVAAYFVFSSGSGNTPAAPASQVSPSARTAVNPLDATLRAATADAIAAHSVHVDMRNVSKEHGTAVFSQDDGSTSGVQRISIYGGHVTVEVAGSSTWFTGDRPGLLKYMQLTPTQVSQVLGHWVALSPGQPGYAAVTSGVTLPSVMQNIGIVGPLRRLPATQKAGQRVYGLRGRPADPGFSPGAITTLWITVGPHPMPVEFDAHDAGTSTRARFSHWGERVAVQEPSTALSVG